MRDTRNARVLQLAWQLEHQLSADVTSALEAINERLSRADGYPTQTIGAAPPLSEPHPRLEGECASCDLPRPCPHHDGATLTATERAADVRYREGEAREQIRDRLDGMEIAIRDFMRYLRTVIGRPTADDVTHPVPMCRDAQVGKHAVAEWGDALCPMTADKGGLCAAHYWQWYKARRRDGIRVSSEHEPAA